MVVLGFWPYEVCGDRDGESPGGRVSLGSCGLLGGCGDRLGVEVEQMMMAVVLGLLIETNVLFS